MFVSRSAHLLLVSRLHSPSIAMDPITSQRLGRAIRYGVIGAVVLIGLSLVATVYSTYRGVSSASDTLIRGQTIVFVSAYRSASRGLGRALDADELEALVEENHADGLRYVALLSPDGSIAVEAGTPPADRDRLASELERRFRPQRIGDRIRVRTGGRRSSKRRPAAVIEFIPQMADDLRENARNGLALGALVGAALLGMALLLIRWFLRRAELERKLAHERRLASLGEMSAVLAHEIRNPIASLKGNAQLLVKMLRADGGKSLAKAERVVDESARLETLTNDLLEFSRAGEIERTPVDPAALLRDALEGRPCRVAVADTGAPVSWLLDGPRIGQVLANLLDNACDANAESPEEPVEAAVTVEGDQLVFEVRDRGDGIASDDLEHLFEPFFTRKTRGTGLGLAVARRLVELHGGSITAANHPDGGAVFRVAIPNG
jgi:two-component system sensor histidine kinase HydH